MTRAPYPLPRPAPPAARPGGLYLDGNQVLLTCGRTGRAFLVARRGSYRGAGAVHGWPWGTLEGIVRSLGFVHGPRGWAHPDAEQEAARRDANQVRQLELIAPTSCAKCGRLYGQEAPAPRGMRSHGLCARCAHRAEQEASHRLDALDRTCKALGLGDARGLWKPGRGKGSRK